MKVNRPYREADRQRWWVRWSDEHGHRCKRSFDRHADAEHFIAVEAARVSSRALHISLREILDYVDGRLVATDPEWVALIGSPGAETGPWGEAVATFRKKRT